MKKYFYLIVILFNIPSCKEEYVIPIPPSIPPMITLSLDDVSCTEAWLNLKLENITLPVDLELRKDSTVIKIFFSFNSSDTTLYIDSLLPNQTYNFQSVIQSVNHSSNLVNVTTLDTTSHNFTWQTFEFGQHSSSVLYDVAIIDENNIWAVGEIYMNDSLGNPDPTFYNAIHWDGIQWNPIRILYIGGTWSIKTVFAFSSNDIWFSAFVRYLNGQFIELPIPAILIGWNKNRIWGNSSSDLYVVGNSGNIAYYNGSQWTKIESGTTLHLIDIYGYDDGNVYSAGVNIPEVKGVLLKGNSQNQFSPMITGEIINPNELFQKLYGELSSVWIDDNNTIYTGGNLLYNFKNNKWDYVRSLPENYIGGNPGTYYRGFIYSIRGNASNDYIIAGDRNTLKHFNGITWEQIGLPYTPSSSIIWFSVNVKTNIVVAAGTEDGKAKVILLKRL